MAFLKRNRNVPNMSVVTSLHRASVQPSHLNSTLGNSRATHIAASALQLVKTVDEATKVIVVLVTTVLHPWVPKGLIIGVPVRNTT